MSVPRTDTPWADTTPGQTSLQCMLGYTPCPVHAGIYTPPAQCSGGSKGGTRDAHPPLGVQILSISCSFRENLAKSYVGAPRRGGAPSSGKSWIRHCIACWDRHGYCCRRYAPYLNAFLLCLIFFQIAHRRLNVYFTKGSYHTPGRLVEGGVDLSFLKLKGVHLNF